MLWKDMTFNNMKACASLSKDAECRHHGGAIRSRHAGLTALRQKYYVWRTLLDRPGFLNAFRNNMNKKSLLITLRHRGTCRRTGIWRF
jgi:hypothetical protein